MTIHIKCCPKNLAPPADINIFFITALSILLAVQQLKDQLVALMSYRH